MGLGKRLGWVACLLAAGCATAPPLDNPVMVRVPDAVENPVLVSPGMPTAAAYREVFEKTIIVVDGVSKEVAHTIPGILDKLKITPELKARVAKAAANCDAEIIR